MTAVALIVIAIIGSAYATGGQDRTGARSAVTTPGSPAASSSETAGAADGTGAAGHGDETGTPNTGTGGSDTVGLDTGDPDTDGRASSGIGPAVGETRLPAEPGGGPFGSRRTTGSRQVALTFDDGPDPRYTPQALTLLRQHRVTATFCLVGTNVRVYPGLVRAIVADGHTLCNHSWDHDLGLGSRSRATIRANLKRTNDAIRAAAPGAPIAYYRQPGGNWTAAVVAVARDLGMTSLHWAVDPQDWRRPGAASITARVTAATAAGAIVLLHDAGGDRRGTISALRSILPNLTRRFELGALPAGI